MKINNPERRLNQFWGHVDRKHVEIIKQYVSGQDILDMGCGFGTTTNYLTSKGYNCVGIDYDKSSIEYCNRSYPNCLFQAANAENLPFDDCTFDTIILRDALHHFYGEADFIKIKNEILRVSRKSSKIIFFDPNINLILRTMRRLSAHNDEECDYETALMIMQEMNCKVLHTKFNTLYSLPLSGGYVGINFVPDVSGIYNLIITSENILEELINKTPFGRYLCLRYLIVGQRM